MYEMWDSTAAHPPQPPSANPELAGSQHKAMPLYMAVKCQIGNAGYHLLIRSDSDFRLGNEYWPVSYEIE